jgi:hypothetical protein
LVGGVYFMLVRGLLPIDVASPWIERALEEQLGPGYRVQIRSTRLEYDLTGAPLLRVHRIRVHGPHGKVIASAPSAEVGLDGASLMMGMFRARRIDLVGAKTTVYVGTDGRIAIAAGQDATPFGPGFAIAADTTTAGIPAGRSEPVAPQKAATAPLKAEPFHFPQLVRWLDSFEKSGLDGVALSQIGLKQGTLVVENATSGRTWNFSNINIQFARPADGGLLFTASSSGTDKEWNVTATVGAVADRSRAIDVVARNLAPHDILLAAGFGDLDLLAETPISGILRAQIAQDGRLLSGILRASAESGAFGSATNGEARFDIDEAQLQLRFDPERGATLVEPFALRAGPNRLALNAIIEAPKDGEPTWSISVPQGQVVLSHGRDGEAPLVLDRVGARGVYDPRLQRLIIQQGDLAGATTSGAFSGSISFGQRPMLALGVAASKMPVSAAKKLWPSLVAPATRAWAMERVEGGLVERILIALNIPLDTIGKADVELPDPAVRFEMTASGAAFRPAANLPVIRDADVSAIVTGHTARVRIGKGVLDTPAGRRIALSDGVLEVANHVPPNPNGSIRFRFDGNADAVAEMVATDLLKGAAGFTVDPATAKGSVSARLRVDLVFRSEIRGEEVDYLAEGDVSGFAAERVVRGQRVDGINAKVSVTPALVTVKGEGRLAGAPANFEFRKFKTKNEADFRLTTTFDDAVRAQFGIDLVPWLTGPVGIRAQGRITERETRVDIENDLTAAKIADLVPGWQKPAGRSSKATYRLIEREGGLKFEDLSVAGSGATLKGTLELDSEGGFVSANLPVFHLSDGDKASLRAERTPDGALRVSVRGDVLDARGAIRGMTEGPAHAGPGKTYPPRDLDLELRLGAATGNNGEVARQLDLRLLRRNGEIRAFSLVSKIGRDASLVGELRAREGGRPVLYVTSGDAGALFRFADFYNRVFGGQTTVMIDAPRADGAPQEGIVDVREFMIRGEPAFDRAQAVAPSDANDVRAGRSPAQGIAFLQMQVGFVRTPGKFNIREAAIFGPTVGATVEGELDFAADRVHLTGTYIPAFALNSIVPNLPFIGPIIAPKEGLYGIPFEIVGPASKPTLRVNPVGAALPGHLRSLFNFRRAFGAEALPPVDR